MIDPPDNSAGLSAVEGLARRAAQLEVIGAPPEFWSLGANGAAAPTLDRRDVALTAAVAAELGVAVGDAILLRLPIAGSVPADSTLGAVKRTTYSGAFQQNGDLLTFAGLLQSSEGQQRVRAEGVVLSRREVVVTLHVPLSSYQGYFVYPISIIARR